MKRSMQNKTLASLARKIQDCRRCPLFKTAKNSVSGEGDPKSGITFIGEAPGRYEDETGRPFVGRAGKLLDKLLESIKLKREDVYITSVIKHRPPKNRQPKSPEIKACSYWLNQQLSVINPRLIVTLGRIGMEYFLPEKKISAVHGKIQKMGKYTIFPVYHPAAGLRSTRNRLKLFEDFSKLKEIIKSSF